jgi:hypothetical protein
LHDGTEADYIKKRKEIELDNDNTSNIKDTLLKKYRTPLILAFNGILTSYLD